MPREVLLITGSRADWGPMRSLAQLLNDAPEFVLTILATGAHLDPQLGQTVSEIEADGFVVGARLRLGESGDDAKAIACGLSQVVSGVAQQLAHHRPDLMLVLGDRYEALGAAIAAHIGCVPIAHLCGGDITEGAIDDSSRHAITKLAHIHFVTNDDAAARVRQMGEDPRHVHVVGSPGLDGLQERPRQERRQLLLRLGLPVDRPMLLVTFHPATLETTPVLEQFTEVAAALSVLDDEVSILMTGSNLDEGGRTITEAARDWAAARSFAVFVTSLGHDLYVSALAAAAAVVGNSSSGLYEAPSFGIPTINIGDRQKGRLRAASVIDCPPERNSILAAIRQGLTRDMRGAVNPYGDGRAGERILSILRSEPDYGRLVRKVFHPVVRQQ